MTEFYKSLAFYHNIDLTHELIAPSLRELNIENLGYDQFPAQKPSPLEEAIQVFPLGYRPKINPENVPSYQASVVTPKEPFTDNTVGLIYIPGAGSEAARYAHVATQLFKKAKETLPLNPNLSITLSSSVGIDTLGKRLPGDIYERASYQAAFILDLLKSYKEKGYSCDNIYLIAHSLGGMEVNHILPVLNRLLEMNEPGTKVRGLVLVAPGGVIDQNPLQPVKGVSTFLALERGIREMWPTPMDVFKVAERLEEAKTKNDPSEQFRLEMLLSKIRDKYDNPKYLTEDEAKTLKGIDEELKFATSEKRKKKFLRKRYKLLLPAIKRISDSSIDGYCSPGKNFKVMISSMLPGLGIQAKQLPRILRDWRIEVTKPRPRWLREMVGIPVAFIWGEGDLGDVFFPADKAQRMDRDYFPNSPAVYEATVKNWPHEALISNTEKFASIVADIIRRMFENPPTTEQKKIKLYY